MFRVMVALAVLAVATACTDSGEPAARPSAAPSVSVSASASPSPALMFEGQSELYAFADAVRAALQRVRPGATLEPEEMSVIRLPSSPPAYQLRGLLTVDGRSGIINALLETGGPGLTCEGFENCRLVTGACGATVRVVGFERRVDRGRPRDIEYRAAARRGTVTVSVSADNSATWWENGSQAHTQTGQPPPLTADQLHAIVDDPATNVLSPAC